MFATVVEWQEFREDVIFWKWNESELKSGSRLIIKPGQDAVFLYNGRVEGIFQDEGNFEIESDIIPVLSSLRGFKFGFNSGLRAEVLFVNTKEMTVKWGTRNAINIPVKNLPGGLPIRAFGTFVFKVSDYLALIDKIAGVKQMYTVDELKDRVISLLDQYLMKWIMKEGKDLFNLQVNAMEIGEGIKKDLDYETVKLGISIQDFTIQSFNYPEEIQDKINKAAAVSMVGDISRYQQVSVADSMTDHDADMGDALGTAMGMATTMRMADKMLRQSEETDAKAVSDATGKCSSCGARMPNNAKFCPECGTVNRKPVQRFCSECGAANSSNAKFCTDCGKKF